MQELVIEYDRCVSLVSLEVDKNILVRELKKLIMSQLGLEEIDSRLEFSGRVLRDLWALSDLNLPHGATLTMKSMNVSIKTVRLKYSGQDHEVITSVDENIHGVLQAFMLWRTQKSRSLRAIYRGMTLSNSDSLPSTQHPIVMYLMNIKVLRVLSPLGEVVEITSSDARRIQDLKQQLVTEHRFPIAHTFCLLHNGKILSETRTIKDCNIRERTVLQVHLISIGPIYIRSRKNTIKVEVKSIDLVEDVKRIIFNSFGYSVEIQRLFYRGNELNDNLALLNYDISFGSTLTFDLLQKSFNSEVDDLDPLLSYGRVGDLMDIEVPRLLRVLNHLGEVVGITFSDDCRIQDFKQRLETEHGFPSADTFCLLHNGKILSETSTVKDCNIRERTVLQVHLIQHGDINIKSEKSTFTIKNVKSIDLVGDIKSRISHIQLCAVGAQRLFYRRSKDLKDNLALLNYDISIGSTLKLVLLASGFSVFIEHQDGRRIELEVSKFGTVRNLKAMIQDKENIPIDSQRLVIYGTEVDDLDLLESYDIVEGSILKLEVDNSEVDDVDPNYSILEGYQMLRVLNLLCDVVQTTSSDDCSIQDFKQRLETEHGFPTADTFCLLHNGIILSENSTIKDCDIRARTVLHLHLIQHGDIIIKCEENTFTLKNVKSIDLLESVKNIISVDYGYEVEIQKLFYRKKELKNNFTLLNYDISIGSTLILKLPIIHYVPAFGVSIQQVDSDVISRGKDKLVVSR
jgi:ubiquitin C